MKEFKFDQEKNKHIKLIRGIDFEYVIELIKDKKQVKTIKNPNKKRYPKQKMFLVKIGNHIYLIPFVEEDSYIFLKTIYPSEKYTKKLLKVK